VLLLVIKPGIEMLLNAPTANDGSRISNDKRVHGDACLGLGACASRLLVVTSATTNFSLCLAIRQKVRAVETTAPAPGDGRAPQKIVPRYGAIRSVSVSV
jgi:hypothetical protein